MEETLEVQKLKLEYWKLGMRIINTGELLKLFTSFGGTAAGFKPELTVFVRKNSDELERRIEKLVPEVRNFVRALDAAAKTTQTYKQTIVFLARDVRRKYPNASFAFGIQLVPCGEAPVIKKAWQESTKLTANDRRFLHSMGIRSEEQT